MLKRLLILLSLSLVATCSVFANNDSIAMPQKHNPKKAAIYSAVLPGLGQAYNKKYWKIPIVYAGIGTIFYIADMNGDSYRDYRNAFDYKTGTITDADKEKFIDLCKTVLTHNGYTVSAPSGVSGLSQEN